MFNFIVSYFGFLKHVPSLPHVFDAFLKIVTAVSGKKMLDYIDDIETEVLSWENTSVTNHKYGGIQFNVNEKEIGHIHSNGLLDILFNTAIKNSLVKEGRAMEHHVFKNSGWITFKIRTEEDKKSALELLEQSYLTKQNAKRAIESGPIFHSLSFSI